jgi:NAD(P)-dependent dehydrogenase (short-subunit alcohol dehydrogenase family)
MPYSVTKAAQLHLMRCLASTQGPKVRVNAVSPGLLLTEWGQLYGEEMVKRLEERAWLKKVVSYWFFWVRHWGGEVVC